MTSPAVIIMYCNLLVLVLLSPPGLNCSRTETVVFFMLLPKSVWNFYVDWMREDHRISSDLYQVKSESLVIPLGNTWQQVEATWTSAVVCSVVKEGRVISLGGEWRPSSATVTDWSNRVSDLSGGSAKEAKNRCWWWKYSRSACLEIYGHWAMYLLYLILRAVPWGKY